MSHFKGSCHCGRVQFEIEVEPFETTVCDCSLCTKKNARMIQVHETDMTISAGEDNLGLYQWNTGVAKHYFCKTCGIYPFHKKRSVPDAFGVNVYCLEGFDPDSVPLRRAEGKGMSVV